MDPKDIVVGKYYRHVEYPERKWLGAGKRVMWEGKILNKNANFTGKVLVFVEGEEQFVGQIVQDPEDCTDGYWDGFYMIGSD